MGVPSEDYVRGYLDGLRTLNAWVEEFGDAPPSSTDIVLEIEDMCEVMCK